MSDENLAFFVQEPSVAPIPLVLDSPHSGFTLPPDFLPSAPLEAIRSGWDAYLDDLWSGATKHGAILVCALFPRTYIDANRSEDDIDQELLDAPWPRPVHPSDYAKRGQGLIRRFALPNVPMYDRLLTIREVEHRLDTYYRPYRSAVSAAIASAVQRFGHVWHIDLHSMKSTGNAMNTDNGKARPDLVISDRDGRTSNPAATEWIAARFRELGYDARVNTPYKGGDMVKTFGQPEKNQHSIQIEINRAIYMDETSCEKSPRYAQLQADIDRFLAQFVEKITSKDADFR
ncbi:N-formylglutamate amidohydrolase [Caballeronia hypogeia]|uniref:N-formylglutamate amidohydrolase n=1 Tax=Caballeronia hypogeia TaxID=1777140 RepID=A0A158A9S2_9BURK|nr:N-formylglutamate amidohydrolase [Caballeronia hypogeia]SAK53847.1 N-formylglutamate amidohydrolase [Caballeronia hypogeia]